MNRKICCLLGDAEYCSKKYLKKLEQLLEYLIIEHLITEFHVTIDGYFGKISAKVLHMLKQKYPYLKCVLILTRKNTPSQSYDEKTFDEVIVPQKDLTKIKRNQMMIEYAGIVLYHCQKRHEDIYLKNYAKDLNKHIIDISDIL